MSTPATVQDRPKGVVAPAQARKTFRMERYLPAPEFVPFLDHFWIVEWALGTRPPYVQRTLPYPCVHLVFDAARSGIWGVPTGAFDYELKGAGKVCGLRFRPGAFRAILGRPLHAITDRVLAPHLPAPDPQVERIAAILRTVEATPGLTRVEQVAQGCGIGLRSLQQLFSDYVGVSPKWTIRRFRLHEAADRLARGDEPDLAALAQDLGYFDQAHFSADFRKLVGESPAHYRKRARQAAA